MCELIVDCVNKTAPTVDYPTPFKMLRTPNIKNGVVDTGNCKYVTSETFDKWTRRAKIQPQDVLLTREAPLGEVGIVKNSSENLFLGQRIMQYRANKNILDPAYLLYSFLSKDLQDQFRSHEGSGSVVSHIRVPDCSKFELFVPPLNEQKKISKILSDLDDKIHLNNQINQTLESIAQAIFKSWFIDFEPVRAKIAAKQAGQNPELTAMCAISGKSEAELQQMAEDDFTELQATAALFPDGLVESELGDVPKGWDQYSLSKMITLIGGGTPKRSESDYWNGDIFWFSVKDVPNEGEVFVITTQEKISELGLNKSSTKLLPVGTTIITARGTVGKIALVGYEMAMNQSCYGVQGINGVRQFMTYYLIKNAVEVLKKNTHGAVFDTITQATFETVISIKPSIEIMDLFECKVEKIMEQIKNNLYENNSLVALRDTLLPRLLSGELSVSILEDLS